MDWQRLFPDSDFRHPMALRPGDAARFFEPEDFSGATLFERRRWLTEAPGIYSALTPRAVSVWVEARLEVANWKDGLPCQAPPRNDDGWCEYFLKWSEEREPDWVLLRADASGVYRLIAGAVCFPSGWSLPEKLGKSIDEIHAIVPGLNAALARQINAFLFKLTPGAAWERENWGLSADAELNHHPSRPFKKLDVTATLQSTWIRLERQLFYKLPRTRAILFAIRVSHHNVAELAKETEAAGRIARALETMPEDISIYKGIGAARAPLIAQLNAATLSKAI